VKEKYLTKNMKISLGTSFGGYFDPLKSRGQTNLIIPTKLEAKSRKFKNKYSQG